MKTTKKSKKAAKSKLNYPWRKNPTKWTDTLFDKKLLDNPSLLTNAELVAAMQEYQEWRLSIGKYNNWKDDPFKEENDPPFSAVVLTKLLYEAIARLSIIGDLSTGRFKYNG